MSISQLTFVTTYRCPLQCDFCGTSCGPRETEALSPDFMKDMIDTVNSWGLLELVVFTGGEPFLFRNRLVELVEHCSSLNVMTRIVTSAYWATSKEVALARLSELLTAGLTEINFSVDDFHQEFVSLDCIGNAMDAAEELGIPYLLAHKQFRSSTITHEYLESALERKLIQFRPGEQNPPCNLISTGITVPIGRGSNSVSSDEWMPSESDKPWVGACSSVMESIVVAPSMDVEICCGITRRSLPELTIGSLKEQSLSEILRQGNQDLIVNWLALEGPESIRQFVLAHNPNLELPERYANSCHLCDTLFSNETVRETLRTHGHRKIHELAVRRSLLECARASGAK